MIQTGANALAQDLAFELGEHREQASHRAPCWRGQIECLGQRYETDSEVLQFLERRNQIRDGPAPSVQAPHQDDIDFAPTSDREQSLAQFALRRAGAYLFDLRSDGPAALSGVLAHGADLQWQCLLVMSGNASV
jgi:hypothetical protein